LVEDLKHLRAGKFVTQLREPLMMPPPQAKPGKQYPGSSGRIIAGEFNRDKDRDDTDSELGGLNDDNDNTSTSSEKYERDVTVLNHCFDDIEKFIARLQHSAAALRELERRRRNRKSKKKDPGEGLLTLRTRPPHEKEFIDIFAKFKLSFNLLAKLKAHIHDPNAPELVHFLFTPLALIVDASHETYYDPNLPARVIHPLLTSDAINLLINCVTSKETELWRSLGDAWVVPRDQWKGNVSSYHPVFFDGWSPEYPVIDELEQPSTPTNIQQRRRIPSVMGVVGNDGRSGDYGPADYSGEYSMDQPPSSVGAQQQQQQQQMPPISPGLRDFSARSDISLDSIERNGEF
jgi:epidermal growth factor receptor kinase substrate 8